MPRVGYLLPTRERVMEGRDETGSLLALAEKAEGLGYDSLWVGDSLLARPRHDPLTLLAAVAARTRKPELGTAVLLPALRNPVVLAQQVATLDRIAEGRVILGVGIAADVPNIRAEFTAAGVPFDKRVGRLVEGMALCRALWTGKPVTWPKRGDRKAAGRSKASVLGPDAASSGRPADLGRGRGHRLARTRRQVCRRLVPQQPAGQGLCAGMGRGGRGGEGRRPRSVQAHGGDVSARCRSTTTSSVPTTSSTPI